MAIKIQSLGSWMQIEKNLFKNRYLILLIIAVAFIFLYLIFNHIFLYCNDAYLRANLIRITPKVSGQLTHVWVKNNEYVSLNKPLVQIDQTPFQLVVNQMQSQLEKETAQLSASNNDYAAAQAKYAAIMAKLSFSEKALSRYRSLKDQNTISVQAFQLVQSEERTLHATAEEQKNIVRSTLESIKAQKATVNLVSAKLTEAEYNLSLTTLVAPAKGYINNLHLLSR